MSVCITSANIGSGAIGITETVIALVQTNSNRVSTPRVTLRGTVIVNGAGGNSGININIRQGSLTGPLIYSSGAMTISTIVPVPIEVEDGSNWVFFGNGNYVISATAIASPASFTGGHYCLESLP